MVSIKTVQQVLKIIKSAKKPISLYGIQQRKLLNYCALREALTYLQESGEIEVFETEGKKKFYSIKGRV